MNNLEPASYAVPGLKNGHPPFEPVPYLKDKHLMTLAPMLWPRAFKGFDRQGETRLFRVDDKTQVLCLCHWQPNRKQAPTLILMHGLEGSADSHHVIGTAHKAFQLGFNTIRFNMRNCGGSLHLTETLYNAGLSGDVLVVIEELKNEGFDDLFLSGCSLGGNVVLKLAGELEERGSELLRAVVAVCPSLDLHACIGAIELPENRIYERWFVRGLKAKIKEKARLYPHLYDATPLDSIVRIRHFDDVYTAPVGGYGRVDNYYTKASALNYCGQIKLPTLVIASEDDPIVPIASIQRAVAGNPQIQLVSTAHGGHGGYIARAHQQLPIFDRFWAENLIVSYCQEVMGRKNFLTR